MTNSELVIIIDLFSKNNLNAETLLKRRISHKFNPYINNSIEFNLFDSPKIHGEMLIFVANKIIIFLTNNSLTMNYSIKCYNNMEHGTLLYLFIIVRIV